MNWDECTGGGASFERQIPLQVPLDYGSRSGDRWAPGIETPGSRSTGETRGRSDGVPAAKLPAFSRPITERALRKRRPYLKACLDELERVRICRDDPILKANSLADAKNHLQALWELVEGNPDSEAFEEMINVLQVALSVESPEAISPSQLDAIWSVLAKMNDDPDVGDQAANDLTQELIKGGVNVFREIG
jgi:hypothetical protein